jgi:hypothetical protein
MCDLSEHNNPNAKSTPYICFSAEDLEKYEMLSRK